MRARTGRVTFVALTAPADRLSLTPGRRRALSLAVAALFVAGVVGLIGLPTGALSASEVVPDGERVLVTATVQGARVMVVERGDQVHLLVAYHRDEGWHGVEVQSPPPDTAVAWAATKGGSGVPALSAVYGRSSTAARVQIVWADGRKADVAVADRAWLVTRPGHVRSKSVTELTGDGTVVSMVEGP
jgi:hypothetical protein